MVLKAAWASVYHGSEDRSALTRVTLPTTPVGDLDPLIAMSRRVRPLPVRG